MYQLIQQHVLVSVRAYRRITGSCQAILLCGKRQKPAANQAEIACGNILPH